MGRSEAESCLAVLCDVHVENGEYLFRAILSMYRFVPLYMHVHLKSARSHCMILLLISGEHVVLNTESEICSHT